LQAQGAEGLLGLRSVESPLDPNQEESFEGAVSVLSLAVQSGEKAIHGLTSGVGL
jgi:seryl-tRNA(Sec) selenium transferase